jgi:hypothetical protein
MLYIIYARYITAFSGIIPIILALINYKSLSRSHKIILSFLIFTLVLNVANTIMAMHAIHNLFMFHIYVGFEFAFISAYFYTVFKGAHHPNYSTVSHRFFSSMRY